MEGEVFGVSLIIFKPRQYKAGFVKDEEGKPINSEIADPPNDRDLKVCEISRFEGWTTQCYCDVGEFEVTTRDVDPAHISTDNVVFFENRLFVIENFTWERDAEGYICTFSGRDMWKFLESFNSFPSRYPNWSRVIIPATVANIFGGNIYQSFHCGWFNDDDRGGGSYKTSRLGDMDLETFKNEIIFDNDFVVEDAMSYGSLIRLLCNIAGIGLEFYSTYLNDKKVFTIDIYPTYHSDNVVTLDASDRGVSNFSYSHDERNMTNATFVAYDINPYQLTDIYGPKKRFEYYSKLAYTDAEATSETAKAKRYAYHCKKGSAKNYAEIANKFSERIINCSGIPSDVNTRSKFVRWLNNQMTTDYQGAEDSVSFDYDNQGRYRFGRDFFLGDYVNITDGFLGVKSKQKLVKVKRDYKAGSVVSYSFEFGSERTTQADKLKTKFREIDRRTFGITGLGD